MKLSAGSTAAVVMGMGLGMGVFASPMSKNPPSIAPPEPPPTLTLLEANNPQTPSATPTAPLNPPNPQLILLPHPTNTPASVSVSAAAAAAVIHRRIPQQTCSPNSGTNNSGCNNSGLGNSGTSNSGINNCGTGNSGVGVGCDDAAIKTSVFVATSATTVYLVSTVTVDRSAGGTGGGGGGTAVVVTTVQSVIEAGATATQTIVVDMRGQRYGCDYWKTQGFTCSLGGRSAGVGGWGWEVVGVALVGLVLL